ncbi:MAG: transcriptional repressor [Gammaproteobacteria bacterium]|nr:transcriptional repressor [Gammaproteobacteria bacterium]NNF61689.1 transcriptional repressor [Gammaproteobacteria bacterium]NNM20319.1 transcriptional repressor [Gammaproteobacteria bacterium]
MTLLEEHGISATRQRREIGSVLLGEARHVTAEQVMDALAERGHRVSKATVYNTLRLFVDNGLLREVHADATRTVFDTTTAPHHHFLNVGTGELSDIELDAVRFAALPEAPDGMVADGVEVIIKVRNSR